MKNILITGVSGYIAPYLCKALLVSGDAKVTGIYNSNAPNIEGIELLQCDLIQGARLEGIFEYVKPDIVYHLASVTPTRITNECDDYITHFNCGVTEEIAKLSNRNDSLMVYTSTDLVYKTGTELDEDNSPLDPLTIYAKTKLMGEGSVKHYAKKHFIMRTSLVYGFTLSTYTSFFDIAYKSLKEGKELRAFTDQFRNAIYTEDAADILVNLPGIYRGNDTINFCSSEYISRYEMCIKMCEVFGFDKKLVIPASSDEFTKYPMVKDLGLSTKKLESYGLKTNPFLENLHKSLKYRT